MTLFQVSYGKFSCKSTQNKPANEVLSSQVSKTLLPIQTQLTLYIRHIVFLK